jgi:formylglycine-generating enzyme required for sulfatase activity
MTSLPRWPYVWQLILPSFILAILVLSACKTAVPAETIATEAAGNADLTEIPTAKWIPKPIENPAAEASDQAGMKAYTEIIPGTEVKMDFVPIPGGTFKMGSPASEAAHKDDEGPQIDVKISPLWMGKCEVTWQQYEQWGLKLDRKRRAALKDAAAS